VGWKARVPGRSEAVESPEVRVAFGEEDVHETPCVGADETPPGREHVVEVAIAGDEVHEFAGGEADLAGSGYG